MNSDPMWKPSRFNMWSRIPEGALLVYNSFSGALFQINETEVFEAGGIGAELPVWSGNVLLVTPGVLRDSSPNLLRIEARDQDGGTDGDLDSFIVDNAVILYTTSSDDSVFVQPGSSLRSDQ